MANQIVQRTNEEIRKIRKKIKAEKFSFCYSYPNEREIKFFLRLLLARTMTKQPA